MAVQESRPRKVSARINMILWVEDDQGMVESIASIFKKRFHDMDWFAVHGDAIHREFMDRTFDTKHLSLVFLVPRELPDLDALGFFIQSSRPRAIVSDLRLGGDALGGLSVLATAYSVDPEIKRVLFTGRVDKSAMRLAKSIGVELVVSKADLYGGVSKIIRTLIPEKPITGDSMQELERELFMLQEKLLSLRKERNKLRRELVSLRKHVKSKKPLEDREKVIQDKKIEKLKIEVLAANKEQQMVVAHQHDLINTSAMVKDSLDVVLSKPEYIPSVINDDLRRAWIAAKHSSILIKSMGELGAGQTRGKEKPGCILRAFTEAYEIISLKIPNSISLNMDVSDNLPPVAIPDYLLVRCALNLLLNSLDAIPEKGWIRIASRTIGKGKKKTLEVIVEDNGKGIKKKDLPKVLNWDFSTKRKDYGIGLFIISKVMERYKGELKIKSVRGKGTTVTLKIPLG